MRPSCNSRERSFVASSGKEGIEMEKKPDAPEQQIVQFPKPVSKVYKPFDKQGEVEPFDIDADWEERAA